MFSFNQHPFDNLDHQDLIFFDNPDHHHHDPNLILPENYNNTESFLLQGKNQQVQIRERSENEEEDYKKKKVLHRDVERQRRQEMTSLYSSLHSLLPANYVKGKRSTSDHLMEAVNYIKHLEGSIKDLDNKRDALKMKAAIIDRVSIISRKEGCIDIEISAEEGFAVSMAIQVVIEEGLMF